VFIKRGIGEGTNHGVKIGEGVAGCLLDWFSSSPFPVPGVLGKVEAIK